MMMLKVLDAPKSTRSTDVARAGMIARLGSQYGSPKKAWKSDGK
jgi:hypothetical protein